MFFNITDSNFIYFFHLKIIMGYSIMTPFETKEAQQKMLEFLKQNYKSPNELAGKDCYKFTRGPADDLSYGSEEEAFLIGFDYSSSGFEREYVHRMCSWMAMMDGKKKKFRERELPFMIYDGCDNVALAPEKMSIDHRVVSDTGFWPWKEQFPLNLLGSKKLSKVIENELQRLTDLYKKSDI